MTTTVHSTDRSAQEVRRHPVRGGIYGFLLGFSVALWLILFAVIPFGDWIVLGIVVLLGIAIGVVWAYVGPAKQPAEPPPVEPRDAPDAPPPEDRPPSP